MKELINIFISYAREDEEIKDELSQHLKVGLENQYSDLITEVYSEETSNLSVFINKQYYILLLVSDNYLLRTEKVLMNFIASNTDIKLIPVLARPSNWESSVLTKLNVLPNRSRSIVEYENKEIAYTEILENFKTIIEKNALKNITGHDIALQRINECSENKLRILDLSNLGLLELPVEMIPLKEHVEYIRMGNNYYDNEENTFVFSKEDRFGLNKIKSLVCLDGFVNLKGLYAANNEIESSFFTYDILSNFKSLKHLDLYSNKMILDSRFRVSSGLKVLDISYNNVTEFNFIKNLYELEQLDVAYVYGFEVQYLKFIKNPKLLKLLNLKGNKISDHKNITRFKNLEDLDIEYNAIRSIAFIEELTGLMQIKLSHNPITDCPPDIYESNNINQIRSYFKQKKIEAATLVDKNKDKENRDNNLLTSSKKDIKLILLGNSNAGKTHLVQYLKTNKFLDKRKSTHGLDVIRWQPDDHRFPLLNDVEISLWDFGGQEYYHDAYRLFLSANAIYIVLWEKDTNKNFRKKIIVEDGETEEEIEFFEKKYWLDTVRFYSQDKNNTPLFLVQNKVENIENDKVRIEQSLFDEYNINESFSISLLEGIENGNERQNRILTSFIKELEIAIAAIAKDTAALPGDWQKIREEIINLNNKSENEFKNYIKQELFIIVDDFKTACKNIVPDINDDAIETIISALNRGGTIVYFGKNDSLKDKIFVNPKILSAEIYKILNKNILSCNGEFTLDTIIKSDEIKNIFINVTKDLDLVFEHPSKPNYFIAPQYLPSNHAIEDLYQIASNNAWQDSFWVRIPLFYYKKLLNHLVLFFINDPTTTAKYYWKHGVVFIQNNLRVLIKGLYPTMAEPNGTILIAVEQGIDKNKLQKNIFDVIYAFNVGDNKTGITFQGIKSNKFLEELEISYNNTEYYKYYKIDENIKDNASQKETEISAKALSKFAPIFPNINNTKAPKKVFISYSHNNTSWLNKLRIHFAGLRRSGKIEQWTDQEILAGEMWDDKIKDAMNQADVFVCLLSADFIASEYIWNTELKEIFKQKKEKNAHVIFVYLEPFDIGSIREASISDDLKNTTISDFEIIPKDDNEQLRAASLWLNENNALAKIAERIRKAIDN